MSLTHTTRKHDISWQNSEGKHFVGNSLSVGNANPERIGDLVGKTRRKYVPWKFVSLFVAQIM